MGVGLLASAYAQATPLSAFSGVDISTSFPVKVQQGPDYAYNLVGNQALAQYLTVSVGADALSIGDSPVTTIGSYDGVTVIVTAPTLESLTVRGSGQVTVPAGFQVESFTLNDSGNGVVSVDIAIDGDLTVDYSGNGVLNVEGKSENVFLASSGNGAVSITGFTDSADVDISGSGATYLGGGPDATVTGTKSGWGALTYTGASCDVESSSRWMPPAC